mmetsp:Transcript_43073/g.79932  ORF Transcript_43073/g.79932 Transcript_43073/m.79932 type:complete len:429 (-) Transcript_43073:72-1358(-)
MSSSTAPVAAPMERKHQNDDAAEPSSSSTSAAAPTEETSSSSETATEQRVIKRRSSSFRSKRLGCCPSAPSSSSSGTSSQQTRASLVLTALELNNVAVSLLERHGYVQAIEALGDSLDVLARSSQQSQQEEQYAAPSTLLPPAELLLARAEVRLLELSAGSSLSADKKKEDERERGEEDAEGRCETTPFACADPIRMRAPSIAKKCRCVSCRGTRRGGNCTSSSLSTTSSSPPTPTQPIPSRRGLLAVIAYNLGLAHQLLGFKLGRMGHVNTATQLYEKSEAIVLSIADALERRKRANEKQRRQDGRRGDAKGSSEDRDDDQASVLPPGVDVTYLARAIVNNMGLILFEYGDRDSAREYFDGLESIRIETPPSSEAEDEASGRDQGEDDCCRRRREEQEEEERDDGKPWEAFAVNAIIARGVVSSPAA